RDWIITNEFATTEELEELEKAIKKEVREGKTAAWKAYTSEIINEQAELLGVLTDFTAQNEKIKELYDSLAADRQPIRKDVLSTARKALRFATQSNLNGRIAIAKWIEHYTKQTQPKFSSHLYSETGTACDIEEVLPTYKDTPEVVDARIVIRDNFDALFKKHPEALIFGEDAGKIGDVNQGLEGLQEKYGKLRVADTGIREATILGQGIGMAMRGLRPIAEIQYLDYILYALQIMSDDLATLQYRTNGTQKAPLIVRTRGHRLEGIWHSGSQMGGLLHLLRGIYILTPRNMTKAAGFYNTLLESDEPGLIIECLNGYRLKEELPNNLGEFRTPIGVVETLREGTDITVVSYGSTLRLVKDAAKELAEHNISVEIIDTQSLLPLDIRHDIVKSLEKTNRLLVVDEDVPGGASSYIVQEVIENQNGYKYLDSMPQTLTAKAHRPAYGTDGDYFSKPSMDDIFEKIYSIMHEVDPAKYPTLY
ncbi:MAG TPA: transketolase C-terminal domain-containing protein, partial [Flavobacteriaceae bacterium]|nr:transketolase C-terminal domain-containing protein [Flavobacteriaceae bacterium]